MEGSIDQGRRELEEVIDYARHNDFIFEKEIYIFYAYLLLHLNKNEGAAWQIINESSLDPTSDPMACFVLANIAMRTHQNNKAISMLEHRPGGRVFLPFPYLEYMLGLVKQRRLDKDAGIHFEKFLKQFKGRNFIKDAYRKLAWQYLIFGDQKAYHRTMDLCAAKGFTIVGSDKSAQQAAEAGLPPNVRLLKARLLFDGGYLEESESLLKGIPPSNLKTDQHRLEYNYRLARVNQELGKKEEAIRLYLKTLGEGRNLPWYYACRSALEMGNIYEARGQLEKAREYFNECLDIRPAEHRLGLHQAAKAGLNRIGG